MRPNLQRAVDKTRDDERLSLEDALALWESNDLPLLGSLAQRARFQRKPDDIVTFIASRNINYTNVCWVQCKFCAFYRLPNSPEGYVLAPDEEIFQKIEELVAAGGYEILIQGGLNPKPAHRLF